MGYAPYMSCGWASGALAGLMLLSSPGCTDRACIQLAAEADATSCPDRSTALKMMTPQCGGSVISVDGEGDRDGDLCCYDVSSNDFGEDAPCARPPSPGGPSGVTASSAVSTSAASSASSTTSASSSSSGVGGAGGGGATCTDQGQACAPACDAPEVSPSAGACVTVGGDVACNPVTNEGCDTQAGEACDVSATGFGCYPAPNLEDLCQPCGGDGASYCKAGHTCFGTCFRFCCKSSDCGTGVCYKDPFPGSLITSVGVCIHPLEGMGGMGGTGGDGSGGN